MCGVKVIHLKIEPTGLNPFVDLRTMREMGRMITCARADLVHAITIKPIIYGGALARRYGIPLVSSICRMGQPGALLRPILRQAQRYALGHPDSRTTLANRDELAPYCEASA